MISHVLEALYRLQLDEVTFFGGTALCRTWLPDVRLSEDIDLLVPDHIVAASLIPRMLSRALRREYPEAEWADVGVKHEVDTKLLSVGRNVQVKVQFAKWRHLWESSIPVVDSPVRLRYSDLPETVQLSVPTGAGFGAMKLIAWSDRRAPRDLFDLYELARNGYLVKEVQEIQKAITGVAPTASTLGRTVPPTVVDSWDAELAHQLTAPPPAAKCLEVVRAALQSLEERDD